MNGTSSRLVGGSGTGTGSAAQDHRNGDDEQRVIFVADSSHPDRFLPQICSYGTVTRPFQADDISRVMDFDGVQQPPSDGGMMLCEDAGAGEGLRFVVYHFCLRGGYLFYFRGSDVDDDTGPYTTYMNPPLGVIPLDQVVIEFPPGGRRVFREHAHTDARTGYELVILHVPPDSDTDAFVRPPAFLVADSLGQREKWASALRARAIAKKPTLLRGGYVSMSASASTRAASKKTALITPPASAAAEPEAATNATTAHRTEAVETAIGTATTKEEKRPFGNRGLRPRSKKREAMSIEKQVLAISDDAELASAVVEFGISNFTEADWMDYYFQIQNDFDAPAKCRQMENWQADMKKSLKGAVLEQYEYFVQASGEMTTMGKEVASLRSLVETQLEAIKLMKEIDLTGALRDDGRGDEIMVRAAEEDSAFDDEIKAADDVSEMSDTGSSRRGRRSGDAPLDLDGGGGVDDSPPIPVPEGLEDCGEEITAIIRECRYNDAIELYLKSKSEVADLLEKHNRPTLYRLSKDNLAKVKSIQSTLEKLGTRISRRLEESLRRKNEALRQSSKRDRSENNASSSMAAAPLISPCALNDDALYLSLLVKMGRTQEAAEAYSTRRSLLLLETLQERPISGAGSVDLVIYAAQISQSFFSCLASSVEGFMDLFLLPPVVNGTASDPKLEDMSLDASSFHFASSKNIPAGAMASIVLWCDSELAKFAGAFGGTRILANLALSPPPMRVDGPKGPRVVNSATATSNDPTHPDGSKERKNAIEVAAQCLDQAFDYATRNLDSVGLPLTPRLAEYVRVRLKGCEAEVSQLLDERWQQLTADWRLTEYVLSNGR